MRKRISISSSNSANYLFNNFRRQFQKALDNFSIG